MSGRGGATVAGCIDAGADVEVCGMIHACDPGLGNTSGETSGETAGETAPTAAWLSVLVVVLAVGQAAAPGLHAITGLGRSIGDGDAEAELPVVPLGYAFSIWGAIFAGSIAYAVFQALPGGRRLARLGVLAPWAAGAFGACAVWSLVAQFWNNWLTVPIFVVILACLLAGLVRYRAMGGPGSKREMLLVVAPLSVFAGWSTVAIFANISTVLWMWPERNLGFTPTQVAWVLVVPGGATAAALVLRVIGNAWYVGGIV